MNFSKFYEMTRLVNNNDEWQKQYMCEVDYHQAAVDLVMKKIIKQPASAHYDARTKMINVDGALIIDEEMLVNGRLIVQFGHVLSNVHCEALSITSLAGMPHTVDGDFYCHSKNLLKSAVGGPEYVGGYCFYQKNNFSTTEGMPLRVGESLMLYGNPITSLHNIHKHVRQIDGKLVLSDSNNKSKVRECVLGLLMISSLGGIDFDPVTGEIFYDKPTDWQPIVNEYLMKPGKSSDEIYDCQMALIDAGYEDLAKL